MLRVCMCFVEEAKDVMGDFLWSSPTDPVRLKKKNDAGNLAEDGTFKHRLAGISTSSSAITFLGFSHLFLDLRKYKHTRCLFLVFFTFYHSGGHLLSLMRLW